MSRVNYIYIFQKTKDNSPKYVIPLQLTIAIGWVIERKDSKVLFKAFTIKYMDKFKDFNGTSNDLKGYLY